MREANTMWDGLDAVPAARRAGSPEGVPSMKSWRILLLIVAVACAATLGVAAQAPSGKAVVRVAASSSWEPFILEVIDRFEALYPHIDVEWRVRLSLDQLITQISVGDAPDIFAESGADLRTLADMGALYDLAPFVERDFSAEEIADFFPPVWNASRLEYGPRAGMRIGIPQYINAPVIWFNRTLFDQAGIASPDRLEASGNWTWQTLLESAQKLTVRGADGAPVQYGFQTKYWSSNLISRPTWIWANGGDVFDFPANPDRFVMDSPAAVEALEFVQDLLWRYGVMPKSYPENERNAFRFTSGNLAMDDDGVENYDNWAKTIAGAFEYDIAPRPMGSVSRGNRTSLDLWAVSANPRDIEATWTFLKFLVSPEMQRLQAEMTKRTPVRRSAMDAFIGLTSDINLAVYLETAATAQVDPYSYIRNADEFDKLIRPVLESAMVRNEKPIRIALEEVGGAVRALYGQGR